jgi:hypothetical protein
MQQTFADTNVDVLIPHGESDSSLGRLRAADNASATHNAKRLFLRLRERHADELFCGHAFDDGDRPHAGVVIVGNGNHFLFDNRTLVVAINVTAWVQLLKRFIELTCSTQGNLKATIGFNPGKRHVIEHHIVPNCTRNFFFRTLRAAGRKVGCLPGVLASDLRARNIGGLCLTCAAGNHGGATEQQDERQ